MQEDTAPHDIIPAIEPMVVNKLLAQSRVANFVCAAMLIAAIVIAAILLGRAWPPRALARQGQIVGSAWLQRDGDRLRSWPEIERDRGTDRQHEQSKHEQARRVP